MLTPGIAGGLTVTMSFPLVLNFDLSFKWVALFISFLLALIVTWKVNPRPPIFLQLLYCVFNTLIIFSVSVGAGVTVNPPPKPLQHETNAQSSRIWDLGNFIGISKVFAEDTPITHQSADTVSSAQPDISTLQSRIAELEEELKKQQEKCDKEKETINEDKKKLEETVKNQEQKINSLKDEISTYSRRWSF